MSNKNGLLHSRVIVLSEKIHLDHYTIILFKWIIIQQFSVLKQTELFKIYIQVTRKLYFIY